MPGESEQSKKQPGYNICHIRPQKINMIKNIWNPAIYHGRGIKGVFFEGWYYKLVSRNLSKRLAIIPGIFRHSDPNQSHAFIQVLDGITSQVIYHRYPVDSFQASRSEFLIQIGNSYFHKQGFQLNIDGEGQKIEGELKFDQLKPWPISFFSPGVMGPYRFVPFMQTYHGIMSLDHSIMGSLNINGEKIDFSRGRGYMEKDWGKTFPRAYVWMQSNHFPESGISITASVATIPWMRSWFRGFLIGILIDGSLYRFTTYLGSKISSLKVSDQYVDWIIYGTRKTLPQGKYSGYELSLRAERGNAGLLSSPELDGMTPRIFESLTATIEITLKGLDDGRLEEIIYQGEGSCGGLEIAGSIEEITDQDTIKKLDE